MKVDGSTGTTVRPNVSVGEGVGVVSSPVISPSKDVAMESVVLVNVSRSGDGVSVFLSWCKSKGMSRPKEV